MLRCTHPASGVASMSMSLRMTAASPPARPLPRKVVASAPPALGTAKAHSPLGIPNSMAWPQHKLQGRTDTTASQATGLHLSARKAVQRHVWGTTCSHLHTDTELLHALRTKLLYTKRHGGARRAHTGICSHAAQAGGSAGSCTLPPPTSPHTSNAERWRRVGLEACTQRRHKLCLVELQQPHAWHKGVWHLAKRLHHLHWWGKRELSPGMDMGAGHRVAQHRSRMPGTRRKRGGGIQPAAGQATRRMPPPPAAHRSVGSVANQGS